jgi:transposase-like protein
VADRRDGVDEQLVRQLTERARAEGLQLTGEGGLLGRLTKMVVESALQGEMDDHLGYGKHDPVGRNGENSRNGKRAKTVLTEAGPVEIEVPRDRESSFEPKLVAKRQRRLSGVDDLVISLSARGLTHGEIAPGRDLWGGGVQADHLHHHRPGRGRYGGVGRTGRWTRCTR